MLGGKQSAVLGWGDLSVTPFFFLSQAGVVRSALV